MDPKATLAYQDKVPSTYHYDYVICGMNSHRQPESPSSASHQPRSAFRLRNAFFTEDFRNRVTILGLQDEQDNYGNYGEFVTLIEVNGYGIPHDGVAMAAPHAASF